MAKSDLDCWKDLGRSEIAKRLPFRWGDVNKMLTPKEGEIAQDLDALLQDQAEYLAKLTSDLEQASPDKPVVISPNLGRQRRSKDDIELRALLRGTVEAEPPTPTPTPTPVDEVSSAQVAEDERAIRLDELVRRGLPENEDTQQLAEDLYNITDATVSDSGAEGTVSFNKYSNSLDRLLALVVGLGTFDTDKAKIAALGLTERGVLDPLDKDFLRAEVLRKWTPAFHAATREPFAKGQHPVYLFFQSLGVEAGDPPFDISVEDFGIPDVGQNDKDIYASELPEDAAVPVIEAEQYNPDADSIPSFDTAVNMHSMDGRRLDPLSRSDVRVQIRRFVDGLARKITIRSYANAEDFRRRNPRLFESVTSRNPRVEASESVVGFYADGEVVIYSDRIFSTDQLNFVLAHEVIGHHGLRSIIPQKKYTALMEGIYNSALDGRDSMSIVSYVEVARNSNPSLSIAQAVEEYLADRAAKIDTSLIARIWSAIKGALNKLGVKFGDDYIRYLVSRARMYQRYGIPVRPTEISLDNIADGITTYDISGDDPYNTIMLNEEQNVFRFMRGAGMDIDTKPWQDLSREGLLRKAGANSEGAFLATKKFLHDVWQLVEFSSRENPGYKRLRDLIERGRSLTSQIRVKANEHLRLALAISNGTWFGGDPQVRNNLSSLLFNGQERAYAAHGQKTMGAERLFEVDSLGEVVRNEAAIDKYFKMGELTIEQAQKGYSYEWVVDPRPKPDGTPNIETIKVPGMEITEDSSEWKAYKAARKEMAEVELRLLEAKYRGAKFHEGVIYGDLAAKLDNAAAMERAKIVIEKLQRVHARVSVDSTGDRTSETIRAASELLRRVNRVIIAKEDPLTGDEEARKRLSEMVTAIPDDENKAGLVNDILQIRADLQLYNKPVGSQERFLFQTYTQTLFDTFIASDTEERRVKRTLAIGYTPLFREGEMQLRIVAKRVLKEGEVPEPNSDIVNLPEDYVDRLTYSLYKMSPAGMSKAREFQAALNRQLDGKTFTIPSTNKQKIGEGSDVEPDLEVRLVAEISEAPSGVFKPPGIGATEFLRGLDFFGVNLTEKQRQRVITGLTDQDAKQRNRLRRRWTPGYEEEAMRGISRHIETRASTIGKEEIRPELMHLFNPSSESQLALWDGDYDGMLRAQQKYEQLKANRTVDHIRQPEIVMALTHAKQKYDRARFMYEKSSGRAWTYKNRANALLTYFNDNQDLNTSDKEMGAVISRLRTWTSVAMLGGSIATGALNYLAVSTNVLPFLGSYNPRNGFGGGFGYMRSSKEFFTALHQVGLIKAVRGSPKSALRMGDAEKDMNTAVFWETVAKDKARLKKMKITKEEAEFLAEEIEVGAMIPAQTNAMMYTSRGIGGFGKLDGIIEGYMSTFNLSEQATRRAVGLAAYRMHRDRSAATAILEGGRTDKDGKLHKDNVDIWNNIRTDATEFARETLNVTLGEYSVTNRPPMWRSGWGSLLYMYKVFPSTSIQMFARMGRRGQLHMLASLWILSGLQGFPFAEDIEDLLDTLLPILGFDIASVRGEVAKIAAAIHPDLSPTIMRGIVNQMIGGDVASRTELGNIIPGTDYFTSGANKGESIKELGGPAVSFVLGIGAAAFGTLSAPLSETTDMVDVVRKSPISLARALADSYVYLDNGAIVDKRGYVVQKGVASHEVLLRVLGFYPARASDSYAAIRAGIRNRGFARELGDRYRLEYVQAVLEGDRGRANELRRSAFEHNRNSPFKINIPGWPRAVREARQTAAERFLKSAPTDLRPNLQRIHGALTSE